MISCMMATLLAILVGTLSVAQGTSNSQPAPDPEEYVVYRALLKVMFVSERSQQLVIMKYTNADNLGGSAPSRLLKSLSPLTQETIDDFNVRNQSSSELTDKFDLKVPVTFITTADVRQIFQKRDEKYDGWKAFRQKYQRSSPIITLSRVGFNKDKTLAIVYVGYQCDWLCGEGNYVMLAKEDGEWQFQKKHMIWIS